MRKSLDMPANKYEIGTRFRYRDEWEDKDGNDHYDEELTIGGYIYYYDDLFYVCYNDEGDQVDICEEYVEESIEEDQ